MIHKKKFWVRQKSEKLVQVQKSLLDAKADSTSEPEPEGIY